MSCVSPKAGTTCKKLLVFDSLCLLFKHIDKAVSNSADAPETTFQFETILVGKKDSQ